MTYISLLAKTIDRYSPNEGRNPTPVAGLILYRSQQNVPRTPVIYQPAICVVAQGRKKLYFGDHSRNYDPQNYLINSLTLPAEAEVIDASADKPYLGLSVEVDRYLISQLMLEMDQNDIAGDVRESSDIVCASGLTERLEHNLIHLVECIGEPMDAEILGSSLKRQIYYEVLKGPQGHVLRNCVANHSGANRIAPVVQFIEENFRTHLDIETIAGFAGMSPSSLHEHFKVITSMSPMQFVKSLRLHRARTLLMSGKQASEACYHVGYSSPSQFSRDFKRFFGDTPRDVQAVVS